MCFDSWNCIKRTKIYISKSGENQETENYQKNERNVSEEVIDKFTVDEEEICL